MKTQTFIDDGYLQVSTELNSYSLFCITSIVMYDQTCT